MDLIPVSKEFHFLCTLKLCVILFAYIDHRNIHIIEAFGNNGSGKNHGITAQVNDGGRSTPGADLLQNDQSGAAAALGGGKCQHLAGHVLLVQSVAVISDYAGPVICF